jgi:hypothetical protein
MFREPEVMRDELMKRRLRLQLSTLVIAAAISVVMGGRARAAESPAADCLAASNASIRFDNEHRLRAERTELLACAATICPADIRNECIRRVDEVSAAIPTVIFEAKDAAGNDLAAVKVTMDNEVVAARLEGMAISLDPGVHTFFFEAPGRPAVQKQFVIRQGQKNRNELITFETVPARQLTISRAEAQPDRSPSPPTGSGPQTQPQPEAGSEAGKHVGTQKTLAIVAAGMGIAGLGVGTVFGWQALSKRDDAQKVCPNLCRDQEGVTMWQAAHKAGNISTGAFIVGGVGLVGAALLWLTSDTESPVAPGAMARAQVHVQLEAGLVGMALGGRW